MVDIEIIKLKRRTVWTLNFTHLTRGDQQVKNLLTEKSWKPFFPLTNLIRNNQTTPDTDSRAVITSFDRSKLKRY